MKLTERIFEVLADPDFLVEIKTMPSADIARLFKEVQALMVFARDTVNSRCHQELGS